MNRYQIIFTLRIGDLNFLTILLSDYQNGCLVAVRLYTKQNDKIHWDWDTDKYPSELINYLQSKEKLIEQGFYALRTWEITLWEEIKKTKFRESTDIKPSTLKEGIKELENEFNNRFESNSRTENDLLLLNYFQQIEVVNQDKIRKGESEVKFLFKLYKNAYIDIFTEAIAAVNLYDKRLYLIDAEKTIHTIKFEEIVAVQDK
ncbi:hypothetical protein [Priestia aryabhattai]|uniref:hypothetical protein n=1 Tax=Priestia aryabhattai TaxID=412384 RepID=UPI001C8D7C7A|nr:hypothetical protein [Priestia aryabhattai]MBX9996062.1 hypothetical protein [Priestia aryabhattai]